MCTPHGDASQFEPLPSACTRAHMWILKWLGAPLLSAQTPPCASRFWSLHAGMAVHVCAIAPSCCSVSPTKYHYGSIDCIRVWWSWRADNSGHFLINTTIVNYTHSGSQHPSRYLTLKSSVPSVASSGPRWLCLLRLTCHARACPKAHSRINSGQRTDEISN